MKEKANEQKNLILKQSYKLIKEKGYGQTTTRDIAEACGMKRGLLHYYYPKKQDILFDIYSDFLSVLSGYVKRTKPGQDPESTIMMIDKIYYEYIFYDRDMLNILVHILQNRELTKIKVDKTIQIFEKIYLDCEEELDREQLFIAMAAAIGAEVELLLNIFEGRLTMDVDQLMTSVVKIVFMLRGIPIEEVDRILVQIQRDFDLEMLGDIENCLRDNCGWYHD